MRLIESGTDADARLAVREPGDCRQDEVGVVVAQRARPRGGSSSPAARCRGTPGASRLPRGPRARPQPRPSPDPAVAARLEGQIGVAPDGRQVGLAPPFGAGAHQLRTASRPVGDSGATCACAASRSAARRGAPSADATVAVATGRPDRRPLDVAGVRRIDDQVVADGTPYRAASSSRPTCANAAPSGANTGPSMIRRRPPGRRRIQRGELGLRERLRRLGDDQHAAAGRGGRRRSCASARVVAVAARPSSAKRGVAAVFQRLDVGLAVALREADAQRPIVGDREQRRDNAASPRQACSAGRWRPALRVELRLDQILPVTTFERAPEVNMTTPCPISYAPMPYFGGGLGALGLAVRVDDSAWNFPAVRVNRSASSRTQPAMARARSESRFG